MAYKLQPILKTYYEGLDKGIIYGAKCKECGDLAFPPLPTCQACGSDEFEWVELPHELILKEIRWENSSVGGDYTWRKGNIFFKTPMQEERYCASVVQFDVPGSHPFHVALYGPTEENYQELRKMLPLKVDVKFIEHKKDFLSVGAQVRQEDIDRANAAAEAAKAEA